MRRAAVLLLGVCSLVGACGAAPAPRRAPSDGPGGPAVRPAPVCAGEPEIRESSGPGLFPILTLTNARPDLRAPRTLEVPTRLALRRQGDRIEVAWDLGAQVPVEVQAGCRMLLGYEIRHGVTRPGQAFPDATSSAPSVGPVRAPSLELGGGADFSGDAGRSTFFVEPPPGPGPWVVRAELTIFETDVPPQHEWSPRSARYRVLLERAVEATIDPPEEPELDVYAWAASRGVGADDPLLARIGRCRAVSLGVPPREALICSGGEPDFSTPGGESVFALTIADVNRGRLRKLLRAPLWAGALDFPETEYVRLSASVSPDGRTVSIAEQPGRDCAAARAHARELFPSAEDAQGLAQWRLTIDRACGGRGQYRWRTDRFAR